MSFCCKILTRPWKITHVIHSRSKVDVSLFIKLIISFPLPLTMWFYYITRSSDPIQIVRKSVQGLVTWSPCPFFFGAYSGGSGGRPAHFRYVYLILSFVKRGPADDAQASRATHATTSKPLIYSWRHYDVTRLSILSQALFLPGGFHTTRGGRRRGSGLSWTRARGWDADTRCSWSPGSRWERCWPPTRSVSLYQTFLFCSIPSCNVDHPEGKHWPTFVGMSRRWRQFEWSRPTRWTRWTRSRKRVTTTRWGRCTG